VAPRRFCALWSSLTITHFGGQITFLALPLTGALLLDATPLEMGFLTALEALPFALFGLFAGVLVDRAPKLPIIIWSDIRARPGLARGTAMRVARRALHGGALCGRVPCRTWNRLRLAGLPGLHDRTGRARQSGRGERKDRGERLRRAARRSRIAGALIQWLTAPFAILLDALSFFLSAWILRGIRSGPNDAPKMRASSIGAEIREGLSAIWRNAVLRALAWAISVWQIFRHASLAIVVLYAARELGFSAGRVGALWMLAGIGSLGATAAIGRLNRRLGFGPTMLAGMLGTGVGWLLLATASGGELTATVLFGLGLFVLDFSGMVFFINYLTLRQAVTPDPLLGRVTATMICLTVATAPFGGLAGGWIAEHAGLRATLLVAGLARSCSYRSLLGLSAFALRTLDEAQEPRQTESVAEELAG